MIWIIWLEVFFLRYIADHNIATRAFLRTQGLDQALKQVDFPVCLTAADKKIPSFVEEYRYISPKDLLLHAWLILTMFYSYILDSPNIKTDSYMRNIWRKLLANYRLFHDNHVLILFLCVNPVMTDIQGRWPDPNYIYTQYSPEIWSCPEQHG